MSSAFTVMYLCKEGRYSVLIRALENRPLFWCIRSKCRLCSGCSFTLFIRYRGKATDPQDAILPLQVFVGIGLLVWDGKGDQEPAKSWIEAVHC